MMIGLVARQLPLVSVVIGVAGALTMVAAAGFLSLRQSPRKAFSAKIPRASKRPAAGPKKSLSRLPHSTARWTRTAGGGNIVLDPARRSLR